VAAMLLDGLNTDELPVCMIRQLAPSHPVVRKWWDYMSEIMEVNPDNSPVCISLAEVFHTE
jgi:L-rhamnose mutarotase